MYRLICTLIAVFLLAGCATAPDRQEQSTIPPAPPATTKTPVDQSRFSDFAGIILKTPAPTEKIKQAEPVDDAWTRLRNGFKLPELDNERVAYYENFFTRRPDHFYAMLDRAAWFLPSILNEVEKRGYPSELALLPAVESSFKTNARSKSAASGLWQFIPSTGKLYNLEQNWWYDARRDPIRSTEAALTFLGQLEQRFNGDWFQAIAAYNAGGGNVEKAIRRNSRNGRPTHFNNLPLRLETRNYVPKLIAFRNIFRTPEKFGITLPPLSNEVRIARIDAGSQIDLVLFAQQAGLDLKTMRFLNCAYRHNITPPNGPHVLYLPADQLAKATTTLASLSSNDRMRWARYRVRKGDVLGRIAKQHGVSVASVKQSNNLRSNLIHPGDILLIPVIPGNNAVVSTNTATGRKVTYRVRKGDTLWDIAQRYGVKVTQLSKWNQLKQSSTLRLGQKLTIYPRS